MIYAKCITISGRSRVVGVGGWYNTHHKKLYIYIYLFKLLYPFFFNLWAIDSIAGARRRPRTGREQVHTIMTMHRPYRK